MATSLSLLETGRNSQSSSLSKLQALHCIALHCNKGDWYSLSGMWNLFGNPLGYSKGLIPKLCICTLPFGDMPGDTMQWLSSSTAPGMLVVIGTPG